MVDWSQAGGVAAVVSALYLPFVLSPTAATALYRAGRSLARWVWPASALCERLLWEDVPDGLIHDCSATANACSHSELHRSSKGCWEETLAKVFSRGWISSSRRNQMVPKPSELDLNQQYLCTDAKTILAFIVCSMSDKGLEKPSYFQDGLQFGDSSIEIKENNVLVAHLKGTVHRNLTKKTIEGILAGYPPWYRESLTMPHGPVVPYPILSRDDIFRAGWVIAVGLGENPPLPLVLSHEKLNDKPIKRVWEILEHKLKPHFSTDTNIEAACEAVDFMWKRQTASGVDMFLTKDLERHWRQASPLNDHECIFAMAVFNDYSKLTERDKERLKPILLPVICTAIRGSYTVVRRLRRGPNTLFIPNCLRDPGRLVFLRDCSSS